MGDDVKFTVAEIVKNKLVPYPNMEVNEENYNNPSKNFISVQSVVADGRAKLFVLDTASPMFIKPIKYGAKLVAIDLKTNKILNEYSSAGQAALALGLDTKAASNIRRTANGTGKSAYGYNWRWKE